MGDFTLCLQLNSIHLVMAGTKFRSSFFVKSLWRNTVYFAQWFVDIPGRGIAGVSFDSVQENARTPLFLWPGHVLWRVIGGKMEQSFLIIVLLFLAARLSFSHPLAGRCMHTPLSRARLGLDRLASARRVPRATVTTGASLPSQLAAHTGFELSIMMRTFDPRSLDQVHHLDACQPRAIHRPVAQPLRI